MRVPRGGGWNALYFFRSSFFSSSLDLDVLQGHCLTRCWRVCWPIGDAIGLSLHLTYSSSNSGLVTPLRGSFLIPFCWIRAPFGTACLSPPVALQAGGMGYLSDSSSCVDRLGRQWIYCISLHTKSAVKHATPHWHYMKPLLTVRLKTLFSKHQSKPFTNTPKCIPEMKCISSIPYTGKAFCWYSLPSYRIMLFFDSVLKRENEAPNGIIPLHPHLP